MAILQIKMAENKGCTMLCQPTTLTAEQSTQLAKLISEEYHVHMYVILVSLQCLILKRDLYGNIMHFLLI